MEQLEEHKRNQAKLQEEIDALAEDSSASKEKAAEL